MVDIRAVGMRVLQWRMGVQMGMTCLGIRQRFSMGMIMMTIGVGVAMLVIEGRMVVSVGMTFSH